MLGKREEGVSCRSKKENAQAQGHYHTVERRGGEVS